MPEPKLRGSACTPGEESPQGDCAEGLICLPAPGGYCVSPCGAGAPACPADGACMDSSRGGEWCAKRCESDADCRAAEGYACDPTWKACMLPGAVAPRAPVCDAAAPLPRKRFGKVDALSTAAGPGAYHFEPASALAPDGTLVTTYIAGQLGLGGANGLGVARVGADGALDLDHPFASDRENHFDPWMAADRGGNLVLVWLGFDGGRAPEKRMQIGLARSADAGKTLDTPIPAHDATVDCPDEAPGCLDTPMVVV